MDTVAPSPPVTAAPARRPRVSLWLLRAVVTVHLLAVAVQPVLAGLFLTGDVAAIEVHGLVGSVLAAWSLLVIAVTVGYVAGGHGKLWVLPAMVVLFLAEGFQIGMGYARTLQAHIPLGVVIVAVSLLLAIWVWSPWARVPRGARPPASVPGKGGDAS